MGARIMISNSNKWFDPQTSSRWREAYDWDGEHNVSLATGKHYHHESLYRTAKGAWILRSWSDTNEYPEYYEQIDQTAAIAWLRLNCYGTDADGYLPEDQLLTMEI